MELYVGVDLFFVTKPLPRFLKAFLKYDRGIYYIYVNDNLSTEEQMKAIKHEYLHLIHNDIEDEELTEEIERRSHE